MDKLLASDSKHMSALAGKNFTANATRRLQRRPTKHSATLAYFFSSVCKRLFSLIYSTKQPNRINYLFFLVTRIEINQAIAIYRYTRKFLSFRISQLRISSQFLYKTLDSLCEYFIYVIRNCLKVR